MEKIEWQVEGMTCSNCALSVTKYLQKQGMEDVRVNPIDGAVSFFKNEQGFDDAKIKQGIKTLGYTVVDSHLDAIQQAPLLSNNKKRFLFCLPFTLVLMLHMLHRVFPLHWLMNSWVQLGLCLPVFITGMWFFGRSALQSLQNRMPNMDVLITIGALASFIYSLTGAILHLGDEYLFFETTASIITLVFMGNYLEDVSIQRTQKAIKSLASSQKVMANMIAFDGDHKENIFPVENTVLKTGDLILIRTGEQVPADCKILWGDCAVNEAVITGESLPVAKQKKDSLIGGSIVEQGQVKAQVTAAGNNTVLAGIVQMVKNAQAEKPPMQKMADKISAMFVPLVIGIAIITFIANFVFFHISPGSSLMRAVAVLVISCPCAMGLATPAAIAVGLGRAAKSGILFRNASSLESFKNIARIVFDKTGTLTTGQFTITNFFSSIHTEEFKKITYSLEKFSNHPIAKAIAKEWKINEPLKWSKMEEIKGLGMRAEDNEGNVYEAGSYKIVPDGYGDVNHNIFIIKNKTVLGWIDVKDEIRPEAKQVIQWLHAKNIKTILLSGDKKEKCEEVALQLGIDEVIAEQTPAQKLEKISNLNAEAPTAMVGDGINDAPALAKATLGISLSDASQIAMQSADVILMNHGLKNLPNALGLGSHTYLTIKQNLFWAFIYNIVAIPIAAIGLLSPIVAALAMGFSDVVLAINSVRLFVKKVL
ncbi:MAG: cadmium-translocating P-type ATPase [Bacteroidetes bacterium]|nr:cadmium-translocating P-type ATPase [Bacteroidota bacterium]